jgi:DNA primase catalytic core
MGLHKLTAGDGYTYLTRQVAVHDATDRGHSGLADYYAEKGESPGRWWGTGLAAVDLAPGSVVTEQQMLNLFGEGRHPDAERLEDAALDAGKTVAEAMRASQLGRLFAVFRGGQPEFIRETAARYVAYNLDHGAHWKTPVPADVRARIRTDLADELFAREHGRAPLDERERGAFMAVATRQQTTAVAGFDLTFTPVKTVSTLWAIADRDTAKKVEDAHHAAVEATLGWLEREVLYTRRGRAGVQQVKAQGLLAAVFTHRDARSSDPHLHTHVAVSNKVQDADGRWLAVDARVLYKANVTLSETYNTLLEAELTDRLGLRFEARTPEPGHGGERRVVREVVGIDPRLASAWSSRRRAIETQRRQLAAEFQTTHGRPPTVGEAVTLAEKAWDQTRQAKHEPRSEADQRATWRAEAVAVLGSDTALDAMVQEAIDSPAASVDASGLDDGWVADAAAAVVERVSTDRATWQAWHLRAEAQRHTRTHGPARGIGAGDLETVVDRIVAAAISDHSIAFDDPDPLHTVASAAAVGVAIPAPLQRDDTDPAASSRTPGVRETVSVYSLAGTRTYTSAAVLDAERDVLDAADRTGGRAISHVRVGVAVAEAVANGLELNAAQQAMVTEMATSGRLVQLALAPAGTGKTTAMRILTRAWQHSGGTVIGLAPSAVAAAELRESIASGTAAGIASGTDDVRTDTLAKLVWHAQHGQNGDVPRWMRAIDDRTMVLVDEAGMASTTDLAAVIRYVNARGGLVRLVGDDRQLASVAAGGVLRDIAHEHGAVTLTEVHRFRHRDGSPNHAEAAATLALRDGDPAALAFYADRGRIHVGDLGTCTDHAYAAWAADRAAGIESVLIAPARDLVAELNTRARNDRIRHVPPDQIGAIQALGDGTYASAGDTIITRTNDRRLHLSATDWVKNGDRWTIKHVHTDGSLTATHLDHGTRVRLPAGYVEASVQLGYATTVHGAQGITTGSSHLVLTGAEDRNLLYVALSRGRHANHLYLDTTSDGDPHQLIHPDALLPPTALDRLADILRRDGTPTSATTTARDMVDPARLLHDAAARYHDAIATAAEHHHRQQHGPEALLQLEHYAEVLVPGIADATAWPTLRSHLALAAVNGHDPRRVLDDAVAVGRLDDARDPAAVLDTRIHDAIRLPSGPLEWLPAIPAVLADDLDWGPYLTAYQHQIDEHLDAVRTTAEAWDAATAPTWALPFIDDNPGSNDMRVNEMAGLRADLAVWRAVTDVDDNDLRPTGPRAIGTPGHVQRRLDEKVLDARPAYPYEHRSWYQALPDEVLDDPWLTPLCHRLARLERAGLPVTDHIKTALTTEPTTEPSADPSAVGPANDDSGSSFPGACEPRPLPDEHQAAALWWRLVPHLGPAALTGDRHTADLLQPAWRPVLDDLVGTDRAAYLTTTPAWPALVAALDEVTRPHQTPTRTASDPRTVLDRALAGIPDDGTLTGIEVADALAIRIARIASHGVLNDQTSASDDDTPLLNPPPDPADSDHERPPDADEIVDSYHRTHDSHTHADADEGTDLGAYDAVVAAALHDPYESDMPWHPTVEVTAEDAFPDPDAISPERIHDLNRQALDYYRSAYDGSWAPGYLEERLGADIARSPVGDRFPVGYAPPGPRSLRHHLTSAGATIDELEQAGLVRLRHRRDGTTDHVDVFRDRLILPIHAAAESRERGDAVTIGFVGRRNPSKTDNDYAGPKYLNTKTTPAFTKSTALYGHTETRDLLVAGAQPVIVEGPLDALAITLATTGDMPASGRAVGLAPLGTALTTDQVKLIAHDLDLTTRHDQITVATDADPAGWTAARKAYWHLTTAGLDPRYLQLAAGTDPADLLRREGPDALARALEQAPALGDVMTNHLLATSGSWGDEDVRQELIHTSAQIIAARGAETWPDAIADLRRRLHLPPGLLEHAIVVSSIDRGADPSVFAHAMVADLAANGAASPPVPASGSSREIGRAAPPEHVYDHLSKSRASPAAGR